MFFAYTRPRYHVSVYRTIGPPVIRPTGQKVYLIQAKKVSFVETGKNAEFSIWGVRKPI